MSVVEALKEQALVLTLDDCRRVSIPLFGALVAAGSTSDTYRVPSTHRLYIQEVRAHIALIDVVNEVKVVGNLAEPDILERIAMKAMNCRVQLTNQDMQIPILGENHPSNLYTLHHEPMRFAHQEDEPGHLVLPGQSLRMDATLIQSAAAVLGGNTEYGVVVNGLLVRVKGDR